MSELIAEIKKNVEDLLKIANPFDQNRHRFMYIRCGIFSLTNSNLFRCNICMTKFIGETQLLEHNVSFEHQRNVSSPKASISKVKHPILDLLNQRNPLDDKHHRYMYVHLKDRLYRCNVCFVEITDPDNVVIHNKSCDHKINAKCSPKNVDILLHISNPFDRKQHLNMYVRLKSPFYRCNVCWITLNGDTKLIGHSTSFMHQNEIEKKIESKLTRILIKELSDIGQTATEQHSTLLEEAMVQLKKRYQIYNEHPALHPMFAKELRLFCKQFDASKKNASFKRDFQLLWNQRVPIYYDNAAKEISRKFGKIVKSKKEEISIDNYPIFASEYDNLDSDMSTDVESSSDDESQTNEDMTTFLRTPLPGFSLGPIVSEAQNDVLNYITNGEPTTKSPDKHEDQINKLNLAAAKAVLALLQRYNINANDLTDQQLKKIINFVVTCTPYTDYSKSGSQMQ